MMFGVYFISGLRQSFCHNFTGVMFTQLDGGESVNYHQSDYSQFLTLILLSIELAPPLHLRSRNFVYVLRIQFLSYKMLRI